MLSSSPPSLLYSDNRRSLPGITWLHFKSSTIKTYYCNCKKYCKGYQKVVSRTTFFSHKKYRNIFTPRLQEFLNRHPVVVPKPGPSGHSTKSSEVAGNTGPFNRTAQVEGVVGHDAVDVSIIFHWHSRSC